MKPYNLYQQNKPNRTDEVCSCWTYKLGIFRSSALSFDFNNTNALNVFGPRYLTKPDEQF